LQPAFGRVDSWTLAAFDFAATSASTRLRFATSPFLNFFYNLDDISVGPAAQIPLPSTIGLLGIGLTAILASCKRRIWILFANA
jgi:hypothetical protein